LVRRQISGKLLRKVELFGGERVELDERIGGILSFCGIIGFSLWDGSELSGLTKIK